MKKVKNSAILFKLFLHKVLVHRKLNITQFPDEFCVTTLLLLLGLE